LFPFLLTFPHDNDGKEIKYRFMLTLSKPLSQKTGDVTIQDKLIKALGTLDGIDGIAVGIGRYTIEVTIARTFVAEHVIDELQRRITEDVLSEIIKPSLIVSA
jgi:hypothetical protein